MFHVILTTSKPWVGHRRSKYKDIQQIPQYVLNIIITFMYSCLITTITRVRVILKHLKRHMLVYWKIYLVWHLVCIHITLFNTRYRNLYEKKLRYYITLDMTPYIVKICFYTISYDTLHYYIRYFKSDKPLTMLCNDKWKDMIAYNTPDMTSYTIIYNNT